MDTDRSSLRCFRIVHRIVRKVVDCTANNTSYIHNIRIVPVRPSIGRNSMLHWDLDYKSILLFPRSEPTHKQHNHHCSWPFPPPVLSNRLYN